MSGVRIAPSPDWNLDFKIVKATKVPGASTWFAYMIEQGGKTFLVQEQEIAVSEYGDVALRRWELAEKQHLAPAPTLPAVPAAPVAADWIECEACRKWRWCDGTVIEEFSSKCWTCDMSDDLRGCRSCDAPQQEWSPSWAEEGDDWQLKEPSSEPAAPSPIGGEASGGEASGEEPLLDSPLGASTTEGSDAPPAPLAAQTLPAQTSNTRVCGTRNGASVCCLPRFHLGPCQGEAVSPRPRCVPAPKRRSFTIFGPLGYITGASGKRLRHEVPELIGADVEVYSAPEDKWNRGAISAVNAVEVYSAEEGKWYVATVFDVEYSTTTLKHTLFDGITRWRFADAKPPASSRARAPSGACGRASKKARVADLSDSESMGEPPSSATTTADTTTATTDAIAATPATSDPSPPEIAAVAAALARIGLQAYAAAFVAQGYDDITFLRGLDAAARADVAKETGMKPGHAGKFAKHGFERQVDSESMQAARAEAAAEAARAEAAAEAARAEQEAAAKAARTAQAEAARRAEAARQAQEARQAQAAQAEAARGAPALEASHPSPPPTPADHALRQAMAAGLTIALKDALKAHRGLASPAVLAEADERMKAADAATAAAQAAYDEASWVLTSR